MIPASIFRAYDIRGIVDAELNDHCVRRISQAIGSEALDGGIESLLVGYDGRLSSPQFSRAMIAGIRDSGCHVIDLGMIPTPLLYFATHTTAVGSGVMLTASHNPANYNGLKIVFRNQCLARDQIQDIRRRAQQGNLRTGRGQYSRLEIKNAYIEDVAGRIRLRGRPRVVLDCGNAVPGVVAPALFERLGCEVVSLYCDVDGHFPNHHPDPTDKANLAALSDRVIAEQADLGLAFDGDGDRLGLVTNTGMPVNADHLLMLLAKHILPNYPGAPMVFDVKCSTELASLIVDLGGKPVMHSSGHSLMKQKMLETGAPLGGEFAAHVFIDDRWFGFDDGMYVGARLLEILSNLPHSADEEFAGYSKMVSTPELKVPIAEDRKFEFMEDLLKLVDFPDGKVITLDGIRVEFADGWGLVRASNTIPALLLRFEAQSPERLQRIASRFKALIRSADKSIDLGNV